MALSMLPVPKIPKQPPISPEPKPTVHPAPTSTPAPKLPIKWLWVWRDVTLLSFLSFAGSQILGFTASALNNEAIMARLPTYNILFMTFGFFLVAYLVRENRARHFIAVATLLWILGNLPNVVFFNASLPTLLINWLASAPLIAFAAMVGGATSSAIFKPKKKNHAA